MARDDASQTPETPDAQPSIPDDVHADYANEQVREALRALQQTPDYQHLAAFLEALREGYLVVDVTGTSSKRKGPRVRTIRSTKGQLVLPIFTSMDELRAIVPADRRDQLKGAVMPAREALALISSDRFVAAEFDKASAALVVLRKYVSLAAGDDPITSETLAALR
ncbi:SseB family protein [Leucobacter celer]|uniref:SseB family protein n=1 Tax=Leucobacter celer TaxID=668625 RepID=UPI0006A7BD8C|nr:SseB family protein [Leucobacter celer]